VALLAQKVETRALFVEYRLAPEHPSPACVDDVVKAYQWLLEDQRVAAEKIVFAGDSAGGGLSLLTLLALHDREKSA
jgi:acetyl esterase/lipase